jgi:hypothetical protein
MHHYDMPPIPPRPTRDARAELRASILPGQLARGLSALPAYAQALEEDTLRPVRADDFYDLTNPPKEQELTHAQRRTLFKQSFFEESVTLEELTPYRIRVAYRVVRELLRLRGEHSDMSLGALAATVKVRDPWTALRSNAPRHLATSAAAHAALPILDAADKLTPPGLPLLPPAMPEEPVPGYKPGIPEHDPRLHLYTNAVTTIAGYLGIPEGTRTDPRLGRFGLLGMTNPLTIRLVFPTRLQLVQYERLLAQETLELLTSVGRLRAEQTLFDKYGFFDDEILLLFKIAGQRARQAVKADAEEDKALMVLRLENLARETMNDRTKLQALKALAIVQGLSRIEPDDIHADLEAVYKKLEGAESEGGRQFQELPMDANEGK